MIWFSWLHTHFSWHCPYKSIMKASPTTACKFGGGPIWWSYIQTWRIRYALYCTVRDNSLQIACLPYEAIRVLFGCHRVQLSVPGQTLAYFYPIFNLSLLWPTAPFERASILCEKLQVLWGLGYDILNSRGIKWFGAFLVHGTLAAHFKILEDNGNIVMLF
jgi:hypothetical protein